MTPRILLTAAMLLTVPCAFGQDTLGTPPTPPPAAGAPGQPTARIFVRPQHRDGGPGEARFEGRGPDARGPEGHGFEGHGGEGRVHGLEGPGFPGGGMPMGTWWRNQDTITRIGLTPDQQKRIDDLFLQSRVQLIDLHASLEKQQLLLEPLLNANPVDQPKALSQISKIADTRAELEKTNAKMLLSIRAVLTADQWTKLRDVHSMLFLRKDGGPGGASKVIIMRQHGGPDKGPGGPPPAAPQK